MKVHVFLTSILISITLLFTGCKNENINYREQNETEIIKYIADNNLTAKKSSSGLYYVVDESGIGEIPTAKNNVTVKYKGYFTDKSIFDESKSEGIKFNLNGVISGWTEGLQYFKEGGSGILLIPTHLGYGNNPPRGIPVGEVLIFDIELISIN